jgi:hypothetical protein
MNLGLAGLYIDVIVRRFERRGLAFDPDLIVYGYTLNDIEGPGYEKLPARTPWPPPGGLLAASYA